MNTKYNKAQLSKIRTWLNDGLDIAIKMEERKRNESNDDFIQVSKKDFDNMYNIYSKSKDFLFESLKDSLARSKSHCSYVKSYREYYFDSGVTPLPGSDSLSQAIFKYESGIKDYDKKIKGL